MMKLKIGELARMAGCQVVTIRYYEKEGLLQKPERSGGNYRLYDSAQVERLRFIRHCRLHGMNLEEIRELLAFQENPVSDCAWIDTLVQQHIDAVDRQIQELNQLKQRLEALRKECSGGHHGDCGILRCLTGKDGCPFCANLEDREEKNCSGTGECCCHSGGCPRRHGRRADACAEENSEKDRD